MQLARAGAIALLASTAYIAVAYVINVASKQDVSKLGVATRADISRLKTKLDNINNRLNSLMVFML
jgi:hypothetical protein